MGVLGWRKELAPEWESSVLEEEGLGLGWVVSLPPFPSSLPSPPPLYHFLLLEPAVVNHADFVRISSNMNLILANNEIRYF